ncbi:MAG: hypothetical protein ACO29U_09650 [Crocinitomicaceae bacterium]
MAQTANSNGTTHLVEFSNANATFKVPLGKKWVIENAFTSYPMGTQDDYFIFLKSINGNTITDISKNTIGGRLFYNHYLSQDILPLSIPENTEFELIILKREKGIYSLYDNKSFFIYTESEN